MIHKEYRMKDRKKQQQAIHKPHEHRILKSKVNSKGDRMKDRKEALKIAMEMPKTPKGVPVSGRFDKDAALKTVTKNITPDKETK